MFDTLAKLKAAVSDRYDVERELGAGGMATVYLARDLRHSRTVAIKVLRPELAAMLGPDRFLREIEVAASLTHPNILALYDSGEADGLLYYVMPFMEGESLLDRIDREKQLSLEDALRIGCEIADALAYAHSRGIVHRDIKPANILSSGPHALVADFGIARAAEAVGSSKLTSTGFALGTPTYMSPEQSTGMSQLDGRSDIYSLGCVIYEMLIGEPPFTGKNAQMIMARHTMERVPGMRSVRDTIPEPVEWAITKALSKTPADRFPTADLFAKALITPELPKGTTRAVKMAPRLRWRLAAALGTLVIATAAGFVALSKLQFRRAAGLPASAGWVAVLPFGASDGSAAVSTAAGAMAGLVADRLPDEGGLRAVFPGTVAASLRRVAPTTSAGDLSLDEALHVAADVGAQRIVIGRASDAGGRLGLSVSLLAAPGGAVLARVDTVVGPADNLRALADGLVAGLLVQSSSEPRERLGIITASPLPAVRAYLAGRQSLANGAYTQALRHFKDALARDATLAPAALGMATAASILGSNDEDVAKRSAWSARRRLGRDDSFYLRALVGPRYPRESPHAERLAVWDSAAVRMPDRIEVWFQLGEELFHSSGLLGLPDTRDRAAAAFRRAIEIDSNFTPALGHLVDLAAGAGDTATTLRLSARYLALDTTGEVADFYRWRIAVMSSDPRFLREFRTRFDAVSLATLDRIISVAQLDGVAMDDALSAAEALRRRSGMRQEDEWAVLKLEEVALNAGRPAEAAAIARRFLPAARAPSFMRLVGVIQGLHWGGDSTQTAEFAAQSARAATLPPPEQGRGRVEDDVCAAGLWQARYGPFDGAGNAAARLRRRRNALDTVDIGHLQVCAAMIEAEVGASRRSADAPRRLYSLDSLMRTGPRAKTWLLAAANLTVARLQEQSGNQPAALAATRRRYYSHNPNRVLVAHSTFLREEGRLSALAGDRSGAISAYRSYLELRPNPEPAVADEVARVRAELARLEL